MAIVSSYFTDRYVIANALACAGFGLGAVVFPPVFNWLLDLYGWSGANLIIAGICLQTCCSAALMRPIKIEKESRSLILTTTPGKLDYAQWTNPFQLVVEFVQAQIQLFADYPLFILLAFANLFYFTSFANYFLFLPKIVKDLGDSSAQAATILMVYGVVNIIVRGSHWMIFTFTSITPLFLFILSVALTGLVMIGFPLFKTFEALVASAAIVGFSTGIGNTISFVAAKEVVKPRLRHVVAIGWQFLFQGFGTVFGGYFGGMFDF